MKFHLTAVHDHYFKCTQCGLCCKGSVELTPSEYERIIKLAEMYGIRVPIEFRDYILYTKIIMKPVEDREGEKWCCFLIREAPFKAKCMIYEHRPSFCRLYPLYIGYSRQLDTIFIDVVHCPEVRHKKVEEYLELNLENTSREVANIIAHNPELLNSIPDLDRDSVFCELGDKLVVARLYRKYEIIRELNMTLLSKYIKKSTTWCELLALIVATQYTIRDIVTSHMRSNVDPQDIVKDLKNISPEVMQTNISDGEIMYYIGTALTDIGLRIDVNKYAIHDILNLKFRLVDVDKNIVTKLELGDNIVLIQELMARFPVFYQMFYLPIEMMYSHGYFPLLVVTMLYAIAMSDIGIDKLCACVDMGGIPYAFKYVFSLVKVVYATQFQDRGYTYLEL